MPAADRDVVALAAVVAWRHKLKIVLAIAVAVGIAAVALMVTAPTWEATAKVLIKEGRDQVALGPAETKDTSLFRTKEEVINSEVTILRSRYLIARVIESLGPDVFKVEPVAPTGFFGRLRAALVGAVSNVLGGIRGLAIRLGLAEEPPPFEAAVAAVERGLQISPVRKADVIEISLRSRNPVAAVKVLDKLVALYLERHNELHHTPGAYKFFETQAADLQGRLAESEKTLHDYRTRLGLVSIEDQKRSVLGHVAEATTGLDRTRREAAEVQARVDRTRQQLRALAENVQVSEVRQRNPVLDVLETRLAELQLQREKVAARFSTDSRSLQDIDREIARARELQARSRQEHVSSVTSGTNPTHQEMEKGLLADEARLASVRASEAAQTRALREHEARLRALGGQELELTRRTREAAERLSDYQVYRKGLEERRIESRMDRERITRVSVVEPATLTPQPVQPRKSFALATALGLGLLVAGVWTVLAESTDPTFWRRGDVERAVGAPVLATVPRGRRQSDRDDGLLAFALRGEAAVAAVRRLASRLVGQPGGPRSVLVVGAAPGVGTSAIAGCLALVLADEQQVDVALVDASFRSPTLHPDSERAGLGFTDIMRGAAPLEDTLRATTSPNLFLVPVGKAAGNALRLLEQELAEPCFKALAARFRMVIFDGEPLTVSPATRTLVSKVDAVVLVLAAEHTRREDLAEALQLLGPARTRLLGLVLNQGIRGGAGRAS